MCASVKAYGDEREARGIVLGEARGEARAKKEYEEKIAEMQAELEKYKALAAMKS